MAILRRPARLNSRFSAIFIFCMIRYSAKSHMHSCKKLSDFTKPSTSPNANKYGMLWSAVSRVCGFHFSGSLPISLYAV